MNLFAKAFLPLQTLLRREAGHPKRPNRFRPAVEPLEPRVALNAGPLAGIHHPAAARVARPAVVSADVAVFDGTYQVGPNGVGVRFPMFQAQVNNGVIIAPPSVEVDGMVVKVLGHQGQFTDAALDRHHNRITANVSGDFNLSAPDDTTAKIHYSGTASFFFRTPHRRAHVEVGGNFTGTVTSPSGSTSDISGPWKALRQ